MLFVKHKLTQASLTWPLISRPFSNLFAFLLFPNRTEPSCFGMTYLSCRVRDSFTLQTHKFRMWLSECVSVCVCDSVRPIHRPLKNPSKLYTQRNWPHRNHETCRIFLRKIRQSITGACQTKEIDDYTGWTMNVGLRVVSGMQSRCSCERLSLVQKWPFWYGNWMFSFICALIRSFKHSSRPLSQLVNKEVFLNEQLSNNSLQMKNR